MRGAKSATCAIAVMAKAPQPGRSKTRLVPPLSPEQAAGLSAAFLRDITENVSAAGRLSAVQGYVAYAPLGLESLFDGHLAAGTGLLLADGSTEMSFRVQGFGRCLLHALKSLLDAGYGSACVLNSDSPTLPTSILQQAAQILAAPGDRAVLGPADDGGYYILGLKSAHSHLFEDITWSTDQVAKQTASRAREIGLELVMLPNWYDVDDANSLFRLMDSFAHLEAHPEMHPTSAQHAAPEPFAAPATAAFLQRLDVSLEALMKTTA